MLQSPTPESPFLGSGKSPVFMGFDLRLHFTVEKCLFTFLANQKLNQVTPSNTYTRSTNKQGFLQSSETPGI